MAALRHLAFEGGGGKGVLYLAAIRALEVGHYLRDDYGQRSIRTFAGSSAGAATAFALALGLGSKELENYLFRDGQLATRRLLRKRRVIPPQFGAVVQLGAHVSRGGLTPPPVCYGLLDVSDGREAEFKKLKSELDLWAMILGGLSPVRIALAAVHALGVAHGVDVSSHEAAHLDRLGGVFDGDALHDGLQQLAGYIPDLMLRRRVLALQGAETPRVHYCVFDGDTLSLGTEALLGPSLGPSPSPYLDFVRAQASALPGSRKLTTTRLIQPTFADLHTLCGVDLIVTGTNLRDGKTYYFSNTLTPDFPVVAAVMISMTFPGLWAPIFVHYTSPDGHRYHGWYVDGGLLANLPLRASGSPTTYSDVLHAAPAPGTAGFYLDRSEPMLTAEPTLSEVARAVAGSLLETSTTGTLAGLNHHRVACPLATGTLSMLDFDAKERELTALMAQNQRVASTFLSKNYTRAKKEKD